jgi:hypothetical protein
MEKIDHETTFERHRKEETQGRRALAVAVVPEWT